LVRGGSGREGALSRSPTLVKRKKGEGDITQFGLGREGKRDSTEICLPKVVGGKKNEGHSLMPP